MTNSTIAILGRPNVGKSTLFNRLVGSTHSIVSPIEGVTRDRVYGKFEWSGRKYNLIDTGGYLPDTVDKINSNVRLQADIAAEEADFLLFLVDGRSELTSSEKTLASIITKLNKPYLLVANKIDDKSHESDIFIYYELGMGDPYPISAQSGSGVGDLLDQVNQIMPDNHNIIDEDSDQINLAIVGMPNVGKSSMMNALLKEDKSIVTDIAGTTRDSVDSYVKYFNKTIRIIDTAGLRRKSKITDSIEYYSLVRTNRVIEECNIAAVMIDASKGFGNQDKDIVRYVIDSGKGLIIVVNKWDLIDKDTDTMKEFIEEMIYKYPGISHYPILFTSVLENQRLFNLLELSIELDEKRKHKISTSDLNTFLEKSYGKYPPPAVKGKNLKIKYGTQVHHSPPIFAFYTNHPELYPTSYKRYLENQLREHFDLKGVSFIISFRKK